MKKATKIVMAVMLVLAAMMMSGCALFDRVSELVGPKQQWREYDYVYDYKGTNILLECSVFYTDTDYTEPKMKDYTVDEKTGKVLPAGLTVVVKPSTAAANNTEAMNEIFGINSLTNGYYVIHTFKNGSDVELSKSATDNTTNDKKFKMGYTTWAILYNSIETERSSLPSCIKTGDPSTELSTSSFSWKKLMYAMAINKLVELSTAE